jgi:hypothetical protein
MRIVTPNEGENFASKIIKFFGKMTEIISKPNIMFFSTLGETRQL